MMRYGAFYESILDAIDGEPTPLPPLHDGPDLRPLAYKLGRISDAIVRSGLADLGQRETMREASERCWVLARETDPRGNADTMALCSELIGYLSSLEACRLPVALPDAMLAFGEDLRMVLVGVASRAAFALSVSRSRGRQFARIPLLEAG
jgi:hypothetical protein